MRTFAVTAAAAAMAFGLASCATTTGQITTFESQVIADAQAICGFKPLFDVVTALVSASPVVQTAQQLAGAICNTVGPAPVGKTVSLNGKKLYGVTIQGSYTK